MFSGIDWICGGAEELIAVAAARRGGAAEPIVVPHRRNLGWILEELLHQLSPLY